MTLNASDRDAGAGGHPGKGELDSSASRLQLSLQKSKSKKKGSSKDMSPLGEGHPGTGIKLPSSPDNRNDKTTTKPIGGGEESQKKSKIQIVIQREKDRDGQKNSAIVGQSKDNLDDIVDSIVRDSYMNTKHHVVWQTGTSVTTGKNTLEIN